MTLVAFVLAAGAAVAAPQQHEACARHAARFDAAKVENIDGTVEKVLAGQMGGARILLKTAKETLEVRLGPSWFIDQQETKLQPGDSVSVRGSRSARALSPST